MSNGGDLARSQVDASMQSQHSLVDEHMAPERKFQLQDLGYAEIPDEPALESGHRGPLDPSAWRASANAFARMFMRPMPAGRGWALAAGRAAPR